MISLKNIAARFVLVATENATGTGRGGNATGTSRDGNATVKGH